MFLGRLRPNHTRRKPMFDIEYWNTYEETIQSSMRIHNSAEVYHRRVGSVFQCAHPTLCIFLEKLINDEGNTHADILQVKAGQPPKSKTTKSTFCNTLVKSYFNTSFKC